MLRGVARLLVACLALACSGPQHAIYPAWEPTSPIVAEVESRDVARRYLEASRKRWLELGYDPREPPSAERDLLRAGSRGYTYVRARQLSADEVQFTLFVVRNARVVERALLSSRPDKSGLGDRLGDEYGSIPKLLWREQGADVGAHPDGAAVLTVDQLYDLCRDQVLGAHHELTPRLYFHLNGLLQHCGFLVDDCPDCPVASIQSVGRVTPDPWQQPKDLVCNDSPGLIVAGDAPRFGPPRCVSCECLAYQPPPRRRTGSISDVCIIDPAACPEPDPKPPDMGRWSCKWLLSADCMDAGSFSTDPICTGRKSPSGGGTEWRRRCLP